MPDYDYVISTGVIVVDTSSTLAEVQDEYKLAFNDSELVVDSGDLSVLINAEAEQRDAVARNNAELANQINPNEAGGMFLDSLYALFGSQRNVGERTTVTATLGGVNGTFIPEGSAAESVEGDRYVSTGDATIIGSSVDVVFQSAEIGPIPLGAAELTSILDSVLGWETITNAGAGDVGELEESDSDAQDRRNGFLALQSIAMPDSVISRVLAVADVKSMVFRENVTGAPAIIDGVNMLQNSIYANVDGGTDSDIAAALLAAKSGGCDWTGDVIENTIDPISGQSYVVRFDRPDLVEIDVEVTIDPDAAIIDPIALTKTAVLAYQNGEIAGFAGFVVGVDVQPFDISEGINAYSSGLNSKRVQVKLNGGPTFSSDDLPITLLEKAFTIASNISVIVA